MQVFFMIMFLCTVFIKFQKVAGHNLTKLIIRYIFFLVLTLKIFFNGLESCKSQP